MFRAESPVSWSSPGGRAFSCAPGNGAISIPCFASAMRGRTSGGLPHLGLVSHDLAAAGIGLCFARDGNCTRTGGYATRKAGISRLSTRFRRLHADFAKEPLRRMGPSHRPAGQGRGSAGRALAHADSLHAQRARVLLSFRTPEERNSTAHRGHAQGAGLHGQALRGSGQAAGGDSAGAAQGKAAHDPGRVRGTAARLFAT